MMVYDETTRPTHVARTPPPTRRSFVRYLEELGLGRPVEALAHAQLLGVERPLRLDEVLGRRVRLEPRGGLARVVLGRGGEEVVLELGDVDLEVRGSEGESRSM